MTGRSSWITRGAVAVLVAANMSTSLAVPAEAGHAGQTVRGQVAVPVGPYRAGGIYVDACGLVDTMTRFAVNKGVAYPFYVLPSTQGWPFTLKPDLPADIDIIFWDDYGTDWAFESRGVAGESGIVPLGAEEAAVCLAAGPPTRFTYRTR